jgi:hypothetical protein
VYDLIVTRPSIRYYLQKAFEGPVDPGLEEYGYLTSHRPGARHVPLHFISGKLFTPDMQAYYSLLTQPVLALCDRSGFGHSDALPAFAEAHPNWTVRCIGNAGAMPHFERPAETFAVMETFLSGVAVVG